jgi:hypothetical protein
MTLSPYRNYPLANPEGVPIPVDVLEPISLLGPIAISDIPMSAAIAIPNSTIVFLEIWSDVDCVIGFNEAPVNGTTELGIYHLIADKERLIVPAGAFLSALTDAGDNGRLKANVLSLWEATKKDYQTTTGE